MLPVGFQSSMNDSRNAKYRAFAHGRIIALPNCASDNVSGPLSTFQVNASCLTDMVVNLKTGSRFSLLGIRKVAPFKARGRGIQKLFFLPKLKPCAAAGPCVSLTDRSTPC